MLPLLLAILTCDHMCYKVHPVSTGNVWCAPGLIPPPHAAQPDTEDEGGPTTVVYAVIGSGVALVVIAIVLVFVLLGKRRRAKIWRPTSPSETSPSTEGTGNSGATKISAAPSALSVPPSLPLP